MWRRGCWRLRLRRGGWRRSCRVESRGAVARCVRGCRTSCRITTTTGATVRHSYYMLCPRRSTVNCCMVLVCQMANTHLSEPIGICCNNGDIFRPSIWVV